MLRFSAQFVSVSFCLKICQKNVLPVNLSFCISIYQSIFYLPFNLSVNQSICQFFYLSIFLSVNLSICLSIYVYINPTICQFNLYLSIYTCKSISVNLSIVNIYLLVILSFWLFIFPSIFLSKVSYLSNYPINSIYISY